MGQVNEEFIVKRNRVEELILLLKKKVRENMNHIETINKEGMSVVEYNLNTEDLSHLNKELKELKQYIRDIEILGGCYEVIKNGKN